MRWHWNWFHASKTTARCRVLRGPQVQLHGPFRSSSVTIASSRSLSTNILVTNDTFVIDHKDRRPALDSPSIRDFAFGATVIPEAAPRQILFFDNFPNLLAILVTIDTNDGVNGLSESCFTSDRSCGYMARQGGHQSPQKSSMTTLPR